MPIVGLWGGGASPDDHVFAPLDVAIIAPLRDPEHDAVVRRFEEAANILPDVLNVSRRSEPRDEYDPKLTRFAINYRAPLISRPPGQHRASAADTTLSVGIFYAGEIGAESAVEIGQHVVERYRPACIIVCGIAGALYQPLFEVGDIAFAKKVSVVRVRGEDTDATLEFAYQHGCSPLWETRAEEFRLSYQGLLQTASSRGYRGAIDKKFVPSAFATTSSPVYSIHLRGLLANARLAVVDQESGSVMQGIKTLLERRRQDQQALEAMTGRRRSIGVPAVLAIRGITDYCETAATMEIRKECADNAAIATLLFVNATRADIKSRRT